MIKLIIFLFLLFEFSVANINNEEYSILKKENYVYFKYIEDLIKEKKMNTKKIKEILASKERTVIGNLLKALNEDFNNNNLEASKIYYDEIIIKVAHKIKNSTEAIYIADYLIRTEKYDIINNILTNDYCENLLNKEKEGRCFYYLYIAKNKLGQNTNIEEKILMNKYQNLWEMIKK